MSAAQTASLRQRQVQEARTAMLEAALAQLETKGVDDVSMGEIARSAGVSLRTLYRYFPDRAALLHAAGEHLYATLGVPFDVSGPEQISASLLDAARRLSARPELTRALVRTTAGRTARSGVRRQRVEAITSALEPLTAGVGADEARWAVAVIAHLCSSASWVMVADETGMDDADAQRAVAWAIDRLVAALQDDHGGPQEK
jgi:TetR/AcrR family transcriptional regulator, cholesterol catabolism regulator